MQSYPKQTNTPERKYAQSFVATSLKKIPYEEDTLPWYKNSVTLQGKILFVRTNEHASVALLDITSEGVTRPNRIYIAGYNNTKKLMETLAAGQSVRVECTIQTTFKKEPVYRKRDAVTIQKMVLLEEDGTPVKRVKE